jgi:hypothetical protein
MKIHLQQIKVKNFLEPAMFCRLAVLRQGKRPKVHAKQKGFKNFFGSKQMTDFRGKV